MKRYGANKATEFTGKDIYELAERVNIETWLFNHLIKISKYYGYDDNGSVEEEESTILVILESDKVEAQKKLGSYAEKVIRTYGLNRAELNHTIKGQEPELTEEAAEQMIKTEYPECSIEFTEEGCNFKFDASKKRAKTYTYKVANAIELAKKLRIA